MLRSLAFFNALLNQPIKTNGYKIDGTTLKLENEKDYYNYENDLIDKVLSNNIKSVIITCNGWSKKELVTRGFFDTIQEVDVSGDDAIIVHSLFTGNTFIQTVRFNTPNIVSIDDNCFTNYTSNMYQKLVFPAF